MTFSNPQVQRQFEDNVQTEHFYLTPLRWLAEIIKLLLYPVAVLLILTLVGSLVFINNVIWVFNLGHISGSHRQELVERVAESPSLRTDTLNFNAPDGSTVYLLGGSACETSAPVVAQGNFFYFSFDYNDEDTRSTRSLERKASRMYASFQYAMLMRDAIHYSLSGLKRYPWASVDAILPNVDIGRTFCDPGRPKSVIRITGAPVVRARTAPVSAILHGLNAPASPYSFTGICQGDPSTIDVTCGDSDLALQVAPGYTDVTSETPFLGYGPEVTLYALNAISTNDFWLKVAQENGITDQEKVLALAQRSREQVQAQVAPNGLAHTGFTLPDINGAPPK